METFTLKTAAIKYDVPVSTLRTWRLQGKFAARKVGKTYFVTPAEMDRLMKGRVAK